nr:hypothetical protein HK105_007099 [Polyrhizophydium stewartii]
MAAASRAVQVLEASSLTNAGVAGANLTRTGTVECDAAVMAAGAAVRAGVPAFGAVAAVPMTHPRAADADADTVVVESPVAAAVALAAAAAERPRGPAGLVPPESLAGDAVHEFARAAGVHCVPLSEARALVTQRQRDRYDLHMSIWRAAAAAEESEDDHGQIPHPDASACDGNGAHGAGDAGDDVLFDTVGAVVVDSSMELCAAVSSGGISLKHCGRVGEAGVYGAGVWAQAPRGPAHPGIAISVSGTGEHIIRTMLAATVARCLTEVEARLNANASSGSDFASDSKSGGEDDGDTTADHLRRIVTDHVLESPLIATSDTDRDVGFILLRVDEIPGAAEHPADKPVGPDLTSGDSRDRGAKRRKRVHPRMHQEIWWAHTTKTLCLAYMSETDAVPVFHMSIRDTNGAPVCVGGAAI